MRITLINVQISEGNNIVPPLGILYIASVLELMEHEVQVFDIDPDVSDCIDQIKIFEPQIIGMSCYTNTYNKALRLNDTLRREFPTAIFVAGGVHATARPTETMVELRPDYLVYAEGERTIAQLVDLLESGSEDGFENIKGLYYWKDGQISCNGGPDLVDNLDSIPHPARHLLDFGPYLIPPRHDPGICKGSGNNNFHQPRLPLPLHLLREQQCSGQKSTAALYRKCCG